jgi:hypothetical protein
MTNALNHGFSIAFWFGAIFAAIGCFVALFGMTVAGAPATSELAAEPVAQGRLDLSGADAADG